MSEATAFANAMSTLASNSSSLDYAPWSQAIAPDEYKLFVANNGRDWMRLKAGEEADIEIDRSVRNRVGDIGGNGGIRTQRADRPRRTFRLPNCPNLSWSLGTHSREILLMRTGS